MADTPTPRPLTDEQIAASKVRCEGDEFYVDVFVPTLDWIATVEQLVDDRRYLGVEVHRLTTAIRGCACPARDDTCTHDEPLLRQIARLTADLAHTTSDLAAITEAAVVLSNAVYASEYRDARRAADALDRVLCRESEPMSPAEAAVLDTIREDHTDG